MPTNNKIAAIGDKDSVQAFKALGMLTFYVTEADEIKKTIGELEVEGYGMIFITETEAAKIPEFLATFDSKPYPIIISIPDGRGDPNQNYSIQKIIKNMERAVGSSAALK